MYYVSSVGLRIGITDTTDNVTEYFSNKQVYEILEKGIEVYGAFQFNRKAQCTALQPMGILSTSKITSVIQWCYEHYNNHTIHKLEDFLAMCKVGTAIYEQYWEDMQNFESLLTKTDTDSWYVDCPSNIDHQKTLDSRAAAEHAIVYYRSKGELFITR